MTITRQTRVLLADHPGIGRTALAALVCETPGLELVAKLSRPDEIEAAVRETQPDVVVVDDRLLREAQWTGQQLDARLLVVGVDDDPGFVARARRIGAEAWIPKELADALLPLALKGHAQVNPIGPPSPAHGLTALERDPRLERRPGASTRHDLQFAADGRDAFTPAEQTESPLG